MFYFFVCSCGLFHAHWLLSSFGFVCRGEINLLLRQRRNCSVRTISRVAEVFMLSRRRLHEVLRLFPQYKNEIKRAAIDQVKKQNTELQSQRNMFNLEDTSFTKNEPKAPKPAGFSRMKQKMSGKSVAFNLAGEQSMIGIPHCLCGVPCKVKIDSGAHGWYCCSKQQCEYLDMCLNTHELIALDCADVDVSAVNADEIVQDLIWRLDHLERSVHARDGFIHMDAIHEQSCKCKCNCGALAVAEMKNNETTTPIHSHTEKHGMDRTYDRLICLCTRLFSFLEVLFSGLLVLCCFSRLFDGLFVLFCFVCAFLLVPAPLQRLLKAMTVLRLEESHSMGPEGIKLPLGEVLAALQQALVH